MFRHVASGGQPPHPSPFLSRRAFYFNSHTNKNRYGLGGRERRNVDTFYLHFLKKRDTSYHLTLILFSSTYYRHTSIVVMYQLIVNGPILFQRNCVKKYLTIVILKKIESLSWIDSKHCSNILKSNYNGLAPSPTFLGSCENLKGK